MLAFEAIDPTNLGFLHNADWAATCLFPAESIEAGRDLVLVKGTDDACE